MTRRRLFAPALPREGGVITLPPESAKHAKVLRLEPGMLVRLFDGRTREARARIVDVTRDGVTCEAEPIMIVDAPTPRVHVLLGTSKGTKLDTAIRMLTELGVHAIHPVVCERSVARPERSEKRQERHERITLEACAQSGQTRAPDVHAPVPLEEAASLAEHEARRVVFWEEAEVDLDACLPPGVAANDVWVVVGPEGGLTVSEVEMLARFGYASVGLGGAKLRVETAVPVAVALILDRVGRLRP